MARKARDFTERELFNGSYYYQKIDLGDKSVLERFNHSMTTLSDKSDVTGTYWNPETKEIKYQIGEGCEIDQCLGEWHAALAGLLLKEGHTGDMLKVVKGVRDRYDGAKRNPFNEIECGSNYARSMASFALLMLNEGFVADLPEKMLTFDPVCCRRSGEMPDQEPASPQIFRGFWSVDGAWGTFSIGTGGSWGCGSGRTVVIRVLEGALRANRFRLPFMAHVSKVTADGAPVEFTFGSGIVTVPEKAFSEIVIC